MHLLFSRNEKIISLMRLILLALVALTSCAQPDKNEDPYFKYTKHNEKVCDGPYGTIAHGKSAKFYNVLIATDGQKCRSEVRKCTDGVLSGSFYFPGCTQTAKASVSH